MWVFIAYLEFSWSTTRSSSLIWAIPVTTRTAIPCEPFFELRFSLAWSPNPAELSNQAIPERVGMSIAWLHVLGFSGLSLFGPTLGDMGKSGSSSQTSNYLSTSNNLRWKKPSKKANGKMSCVSFPGNIRLTKKDGVFTYLDFCWHHRGGQNGNLLIQV